MNRTLTITAAEWASVQRRPAWCKGRVGLDYPWWSERGRKYDPAFDGPVCGNARPHAAHDVQSGGTLWLVREGICQRCAGWRPHPADVGTTKAGCPSHVLGPSAEFVQACAPCETCGGERRAFCPDCNERGSRECVGDGRPHVDCPDCRVELVGPCPTCDGRGWDWITYADSGSECDDPADSWPCSACFVQTATENGLALGHCTGTVTLGYGYAIGQPLPIITQGTWEDIDDDGGVVVVMPDGSVWHVPADHHAPSQELSATLAHYGQPETLVGKWALQVQVVL